MCGGRRGVNGGAALVRASVDVVELEAASSSCNGTPL
jgi:hypothetical protein